MRDPTDDASSDGPPANGETFETEFGDRTPSEAVVDVTSAVRDREPSALTPLYQTVDPEALDALFTADDRAARPTVEFDYEGLHVTVRPAGVVVVES